MECGLWTIYIRTIWNLLEGTSLGPSLDLGEALAVILASTSALFLHASLS